LWISSGIDPDYFQTNQEAEAQEKALTRKGTSLLNQAKDILLHGGIAEERIRLKAIAAEKGPKYRIRYWNT